MQSQIKFRLRIYRDEVIAVGPGKVQLLEAIGEAGSISAAARRLGMSYRRAWLLVEELNGALREPAVRTTTGGAHGGGATLTPLGLQLVAHYRAAEAKARRAADAELKGLLDMLAP
ncbi:LysR family transcriptional regulator [Vandammella animalimorsus]|uniref:LysR family transcriptional regulator n=1 Tax=Vandammella animalimorsus TaxID=2029117 RepID=A0A3M6RJ91_9BURK|nr:LysR family transcriptional regulator [Vandammella animalimorsus]RMX15410.1 LysR family transcriptional regulator [Vandammella animalimorsus]